MTTDFTPHIRVTAKDREPLAPKLELELKAPSKLSLTLPYTVGITILRQDDEKGAEHCTLRWDSDYHLFSNCMLFRHIKTADGGEALEAVTPFVVPDAKPATEEQAYEMDESWKMSDLRHIAPEGWLWTSNYLPERYQRALQPGESYTLLFTGTECAIWEWGKTQHFFGKTLVARPPNDEQIEGLERPRVAILGGTHIKFTAHEEEEPWPRRKQYENKHGFANANYRELSWRQDADRGAKRFQDMLRTGFGEDKRVPGAPALSAVLEGPSTVSWKVSAPINIKLTYIGVSGDDGKIEDATRPIMFRTTAVHGFRDGDLADPDWVYRRYRGGAEAESWEECADHDGCSWDIYDGPDRDIRVAEDKDFRSLRPGESLSMYLRRVDLSDFETPDDFAPGDELLCGFDGGKVDWWDWGTAEDYAETVVKFPSFANGLIVEPKDNEGRPKLVIPAAKPHELRVVE
ncbi:hypothetical protein CPLU01_07604 [Colletotrichum plurivorum]|uniref:Uncharacterized protein n=1 Tax=Colletotrichum plurivorum TaxID=2175906 RepID=A0A8H6KE78_9PEZI|nr:hypothetical protein CPLU01_07604 [Colletotrichum plurivorum]